LSEKDLFVHQICEERVLVCLRADDPLASAATLPQNVIAERLCVLFARVHQPLLYDHFVRTLAEAGILLSPAEFFSAPAEMQYLVKNGKGFSLVQESTKLDSELTMRSIAGVNLSVATAFICNQTQRRPVLPMLAYRLEKRCAGSLKMDGRKRPVVRATGENQHTLKKTS
jgi:hypothetical protein